MAFPQKNWLGIKQGWKNLGQTRAQYRAELGGSYYTTHAICGRICNFGKEGEEIFRYCKKCLRKVQ